MTCGVEVLRRGTEIQSALDRDASAAVDVSAVVSVWSWLEEVSSLVGCQPINVSSVRLRSDASRNLRPSDSFTLLANAFLPSDFKAVSDRSVRLFLK